jgi:purine-binding chemotaxis protein CheW
MMDEDDIEVSADTVEYVTFTVDGARFGLPVLRVNDVFRPLGLTRVPLAPPSIAGILNLRGRVVTIIDMDARLGRTARDGARMAITVDLNGEAYGLMVDRVFDVVALPSSEMQQVPANLDPRIRHFASGIFWSADALLVILDIDRLLDFEQEAIAA